MPGTHFLVRSAHCLTVVAKRISRIVEKTSPHNDGQSRVHANAIDPTVSFLSPPPDGDARTAQAVAGGGFPDAERFPEQVWELAAHVAGRLPPEHPYKRVRLQPEVATVPEIWLLGSSDYSGALAAQLGMAFAFAHF